MKINLIVVDFQHDFSVPQQGALYVPGAENAKKGILSFIKKHYKNIQCVWFTQDLHPANHCSFKENGGEWPAHCVQNTWGAEVDSDLINECNKHHIAYNFIYKGTRANEEEYGAFDNPGNRIKIANYKQSLFVVCGLAGDYCVMETYNGLLKASPDINAVLLPSGIAYISAADYCQKRDDANAITIN